MDLHSIWSWSEDQVADSSREGGGRDLMNEAARVQAAFARNVRAVDLVVMRGLEVVAGTTRSTIPQAWTAPGWAQRLADAAERAVAARRLTVPVFFGVAELLAACSRTEAGDASAGQSAAALAAVEAPGRGSAWPLRLPGSRRFVGGGQSLWTHVVDGTSQVKIGTGARICGKCLSANGELIRALDGRRARALFERASRVRAARGPARRYRDEPPQTGLTSPPCTSYCARRLTCGSAGNKRADPPR